MKIVNKIYPLSSSSQHCPTDEGSAFQILDFHFALLIVFHSFDATNIPTGLSPQPGIRSIHPPRNMEDAVQSRPYPAVEMLLSVSTAFFTVPKSISAESAVEDNLSIMMCLKNRQSVAIYIIYIYLCVHVCKIKFILLFIFRVVKFSSVHHLTIHFPTNFGAETTRIYYIGLRGEYTTAHRHGVTICTYEARPNVSDHKTDAMDHVSYEIQ